MQQNQQQIKRANSGWPMGNFNEMEHAKVVSVLNYTYVPKGVTLTQEVVHSIALTPFPHRLEPHEVGDQLEVHLCYADDETVLSTTVRVGDREVTIHHHGTDWSATGNLDGIVGGWDEAERWQSAQMGWDNDGGSSYWRDHAGCFHVDAMKVVIGDEETPVGDFDDALEVLRCEYNDRLALALDDVSSGMLNTARCAYFCFGPTHFKPWAEMTDRAQRQFTLYLWKAMYDSTRAYRHAKDMAR